MSRDGQSSYVEVKRLRSPERETELPCLPDPGEESGEAMLVPDGNVEESAKRVEDKLSEKFRQVSAGTGIIALWSDRLSIEEVDFEVAIRHLRMDFANGIKQVPVGLLFCFGWNWFTAGRQFHCGAVKQLAEPFATWVSDLETAWVYAFRFERRI